MKDLCAKPEAWALRPRGVVLGISQHLSSCKDLRDCVMYGSCAVAIT